MLRSVKELRGYAILAGDDDIGKVHEFLFDDLTWGVRYLVVDTGGWLEERKVLVAPVAIKETNWAARSITLDLTREQVENSPEIDADKPVSRQHEISLHEYYHWPYYWTEAAFPGLASAAVPESEKLKDDDSEANDPHLRSTREVSGYYIGAEDGEIGHVEDFVLDDSVWIMRYLVIDTRNWLPGGKKVLISPQWIPSIDWAGAQVHVALTQEQIKESPEFDPSAPINRAYEERLYDFYGRPKYWL